MDTRLRWLVPILLAASLSFLAGCSSQPVATPTASDTTAAATAAAASPPSEPTESPTPSTPSGIVVTQIGQIPSTITLTVIDPTTGSSQVWRQFDPVGGATPGIGGTWIANRAPFTARRLFTPSYDRVVAERNDSTDSSRHVGWITSDGAYVDVTDAITPSQSDFSDPPRQKYPLFGTDGMFYFVDLNDRRIEKVDSDNLSPAAVQKIDADFDSGSQWSESNWFDVYPDGTVNSWWIGDGFHLPGVENTKPGVFGVGRVEDWLDAKTLLTTDDYNCNDSMLNQSTSQVYTSTALTRESQADSVSSGGSNAKALLPSTSTRRNWNPIASPDGQQVAFLSSKNGAPPELFIVSRHGGDPVRVATDYPFLPAGGPAYRLQLLAWLP